MLQSWIAKIAFVFGLSVHLTALAQPALVQPFEETPDIVISPNFCSLYPITLPSALMASAQPGEVFSQVRTGTGPGNYSWLSWAGQNNVKTLAASLVAPGNSGTYINPTDPGDQQLNVRDWVEGAPGVKNAKAIRAGLDALLGRNIIVPVWDSYQGKGSRLDYHTARFAVVELTDYQLKGQGYISYIFKRFTRCYNHRPVAMDDAVETPEDTAVMFKLLVRDEDNNVPVFTILTQPAHGSIDVIEGLVMYTPNANYFGQDELTFTVHDHEQISRVATVSITVLPVNDAPVAEDTSTEGLEDTPIDLAFLGSDIEQNPLSFRAVSQPAHGVLIENKGQWQYIPDPNYFGPDSLIYVAHDGELDSEPAQYGLTVLPVNDAPVAVDIALEVEAGQPIPVLLQGSDIDSSDLQFILESAPQHGAFSGTSPNLVYTSDALYTGIESVSYVAFDGALRSAPAHIQIRVVRNNNEPPVIVSPPVEASPEGQTYRYPVAVEDPNADPIAYQLDLAPQGMTVDASTGEINWLPDARFVQTVPTFNRQCYVVSAGSVREYEEGDESNGQTYIAPLFSRIREAIRRAGEYVAPETLRWHEENACLGCHVQTQTLLGLQASRGKAEVDEEAADYLLSEILSSQLEDGSIRRSHPRYDRSQTAFALWALSFVPDRDATFDVRAKALEFFWERRNIHNNQVFWHHDKQNNGWLNNIASMNALVALSAARYIVDSGRRDNLTAQQQAVVDHYTSVIPNIIEDTILRDQPYSTTNSLILSMQLITLAEIRTITTDPALLERIDLAMAEMNTILRSRQKESGGWSHNPNSAINDPLTSAWVGMALDYLASDIHDPVVTATIQYLLDSQQPNGTWLTNSGLFRTHLATTSLVMAYLPVALDFLGNPDVRPGHIRLEEGSGGQHQLSVQISNRGLTEIAVPTDVNFYNGAPESGTLLGSVRLERIGNGQTVTPSLTVADSRLTETIHVTLTVAPSVEECEINNNQTQAALVRVRATDPGRLFDTQVYTLNIDDVNQRPQITSEAPSEFDSGQAFEYQVTSDDPDSGDAQNFALLQGPQGLLIDSRTGIMRAAPGTLLPGTYDVIVEVEDLRGFTTQQTFSLVVNANLPPSITTAPVVRGSERHGYLYNIDALDPNPGDALTYTFETGPATLTVDPHTGLSRWLAEAEYVEGHTDNNPYCVAEPSQQNAPLDPVIKWHWAGSDYRSDYDQVMSLPVVAQLNDDNGDGVINTDDTPDIIFSAFSGSQYDNPSLLRAISGADGHEIWPQADRWANAVHGPAVGDIDHDGLIEIIVGGGHLHGAKTLLAYEHDGTLKWEIPVEQYGEPSLADLDNDGSVEIVVANTVYNAEGQPLWHLGNSEDPQPLVLDLDADGDLEIFNNGSAYQHDGSLLWHAGTYKQAAVGNLDQDPHPEIVAYAGSDGIVALEHDGQIKWGPVAVPGGGGGPLTLADLDGDGHAEIGIAGANYYTVYEHDGSLKWQSPTRDRSSAQTGSTAFDFNGDGSADILYADEHHFRIYDGRTGSVRYELENSSGTLYEYPLVVDLDNDQHAEIVLIANNYAYNNQAHPGTTGIRVLEDAHDNWAPTRALWNQHSYHINNIHDDGSIPQFEQPSWLSHNSYRLNTFADRPALGIADLTAYGITYDQDTHSLSVYVKNRGLAPATGPITVHFIHDHFWLDDQPLGSHTLNTLDAGEETHIRLTLTDTQHIEYGLRVELSVPDSLEECHTDNNSTRAILFDLFAYDPANLFDSQRFAVTIANDNNPPEIISAATSQATVGSDYRFQIDTRDPDIGESFWYRLDNAPANLSVHPYSGLIRGTNLTEGTHTFSIHVRDIAGEETQQPHILTVSPPDNRPPVITSEAPTRANIGDEYHYTVIASDPDGDDLLFALSRSQPGVSLDQNTGDIRWTPREQDLGVKSLEITVVDQHGAAAQQYFLIDVQNGSLASNRAPIITSIPSGVVYAGRLFHYQIIATDADFDPLSYRVTPAISDMTLSETGLLTWLASADLIGQQIILDIQVSDDRGGIASQRLTLPVNEHANHPPIITSTPGQSATVNQTYHYPIYAEDQDGDPFSLSLIDGPNGMVLDNHSLAWTPAPIQENNTHNITLRAEDQRGAASTQTFSITVHPEPLPNTPPEILSIPGNPAFIDQAYHYDILALDPDGDPLNYRLTDAPTGMTLNHLGELRWTPSAAQQGTHTINLDVTDGRASTHQRFSLQAVMHNPDNRYPQITSEPLTTAAVDHHYRYQLHATDADNDPLTYGAITTPSGLTVTPEGRVDWTPTHNQIGIHDLTLYASDGHSRSLQSYTIAVLEQPQPLSAFILATPDIANIGDTITVSIFSDGGQGPLNTTVTLNGQAIALNRFDQIDLIADTIGLHTLEATVTDGHETLTETATYSVRDPDDTLAPLVTIHAPEFETIITDATDIIGTVQDDNLAYYRLLIGPKGQQNFTEIARSSHEISHGLLGNIDPTLLHNGIYHIAVEAVDINGQRTTEVTNILIDGDMKIGHFSLTFEDLNIDLAGIPIRVTRTYDTRQRLEDLDFGHGWSLDYQNVRVQESHTLGFAWSLNYHRTGYFGEYCVEPSGNPIVSVRLPDGSLEKFRVRAEPNCTTLVPTTDVQLAFDPMPGTYSTLEQTDLGILRLYNGHLVDLSALDPEAPVDPDHYRLTTKEGLIYHLDQDFGVHKIQEPGGDHITFTDNGIHHSQGYAITFQRDAAHHITALILPDGRRLHYTYTLSGDLNNVTDLGGDTTQHHYLARAPHYLQDIIDPRGVRATRMEYNNNGRLTAVIDADGHRIEYQHDLDGNTEIIRDRNGNQTVYVYNSRGDILAETNALGHTTTRTYNTLGHTLTETNPLGHTTTWVYDNRGNPLTETDPLGHTTRTTYSHTGNLLSLTDPLGRTTQSEYNPHSLKLENITDALGHTTDLHWDTGIGSCSTGASLGYTDALGHTTTTQPRCIGPFAHLPSYTDAANGQRTTYTYDNSGRKTTETTHRTGPDGTPIALTTAFEYDPNNRIIATTHPDGTTTRTEYTALGTPRAHINPQGQRTEYTYDTRGHEISTRHPDGTTTEKTYDPQGNLLTETDQAGRTTEYTYDAANRRIETRHPDGTTTGTEYDPAGRITAHIDPNGQRTEYQTDPLGRRTHTRDPQGNTYHREYDPVGNLIAQTDPNGHRTQYHYTALDQKIATLYPDGTTTTDQLDPLGRRTQQTDQADLATHYQYDPLGRLTAVIDTLGQETHFLYDEIGNKTSQTDAEGHTTRWEYDNMGRTTARTLPLGQRETTAYDPLGNLTQHTDFNGDTTTHTYNEANQLIERRFADGSSERFTYNPIGNRIESMQTDISGSTRITRYQYDAQDRLRVEEQANGTRLEYTYDAAGNRTQISTIAADGSTETTTYTYDTLNRLESVTDHNTQTTTYAYDAVGNRSHIRYPNGNREVYHYDALNRLTLKETLDGTDTLLQSYHYTLHPTGRRTQIDELSGRSTEYSYDALYRLTSESITDAVNDDYVAEYQYDAVGNRTFETVNGVSTAYTYDDNDRLEQTGGTHYVYDHNGNTLTETLDGNVKTYTWNSKNKLIRVDNAGMVSEYSYNVEGIRERKTENGTTTTFVVDSNRAYAQVLEEIPEGTAGVRYTYGDDLISQDRNGVESWYHYDGLGSTRSLSDDLGSLTDTYDYEAFGTLLHQTGSTENSYLYTGEQFDNSLNQYYLRARYYDQGIGRFTQQDTWMGNNYDPVTLHKYLYANADPVNGIDPSGNFTMGQVMSSVNISSTLAVVSAGLSGYSIGSGGVAIYEGRYADGALDIALGFMGTGVAASGYKLIRYTFGPANRAIRQRYMSFLANEMPHQISIWRTQGRTAQQIAESLVVMRNSIKIETRAMMEAEGVAGKVVKKILELRNIKHYRHPIGPDISWYLRRGKTYEDIIDSALKSSDKINRMVGGAL